MALSENILNAMRKIAMEHYGNGTPMQSSRSSTSAVVAPTVTMPTQTARQRMLQQDDDEDDRWYKGTMPTASEMMARIYTVAGDDKERGQFLMDSLAASMQDPSSPIYNPYSQATNKAVSEMAALGYDVSGGVNADWLKANSGLMNHYRTGTGGTPLSPSSKSTKEENAAYWYYQIANAEERTQKAENEWAALQEEITYWTQRSDRNYSDQEILDRIDWSSYKTLTDMDEARRKGVPLALNRAVGYSQDALAGVIWAARNGGSTGNPMIDSVKAALGEGNSWQENTDISERLNPMSERYNPYAVGSTLDEEGLYFGVSDFGSGWLQENRGYLASRDATAKKYYGKVYDAEQTTLKAEQELASLRAEIDDWLKYTSDPDVILDGLLDDYPTLSKMDESLRSGDLLATTRAIDFSRADIEAEVRSRCEAMNTAQQAGAYVQGVSGTLGLTIPHVESNDAIAAARDSAVNAAGASIRAGGTGEEKTVWETAYSADFDTYIGQIGAAINEGVTDPQGGYDYTLGRANEYAAQHYMGALEVIRPYQGALTAREEALQELAIINSWPEAEQQAAQERKAELEAQVRRQDRILAALEPKLTDAQREAAAVQSGYNIAGRMAALTGASEGDVRSTTAIMDYAYQYAEAYEPAWNSYSLYEMAMADGSSYADVAAAAHKGRIANKEQINRIRYTLTQLEKRGVVIDEKYITNMEREIARLEREVLDADYFLLRENEDFAQVVSETRDKVNAAWGGWDMILPNRIDREGYSVLSASAANMAKGIQAGNFMPSMTQEERDTYLYILGTQGRDAAESYYAHMADETYGVLQTRTTQRATQFWEDFSAEHGLTGTALSVIASPMQAAGAVYAAKQGLTGGEINPYSGAFGAVQMVGTTRGTVKEGITQKLGEGSTAAWLANLGYDAATGAADSLLNTVTFGSLGAATMGVNAASGSIQDATLRGATTEQALMLGGAMFLAETLTEQITVSNITKALNGGAPSVKGFFKTLLSDMGEEAVGEGASELLGQISDELIMKEMSVRQAAIAHYMDSGMTQQEAEERANKEAISGILYAAAVGGVSGGISTGAASMAGKAAQQPTNPAPVNPAPQQPTNPAPVNPAPQQPGDDAPAEPQNEPQDAPKTTDEETPAPAEETPTEPQSAPDEAEETPEALTEEQRGILAKQVTALTQAMTTQDEASQTATIAAVLTAPTDDDTSTASAAAQHLAHRYGAAKITDTLREILLTAAETRLDTEQLRVALTVASLGEGAASAALETVVSEGATAENVSEVLGAAESDMQAPEVMNTIRKTVAENQVAVRVKQLVAEGALSGIQSYETAVSQARSNLGTARENLRIAQEEYTTAGENMQTMQSEFSADPTNELLRGAFQQAIKDTEGKAIVVTQMQQSVDKYQAQLDEAQTTYNRMYEDTMKRVREQAQQDVLAMQEQLAQSRAAKAKIAARENAVSGAQGVTYTGDNAPIGFHYAVVDADGLIASNDTNMNVNPEYPQELQPRDRTRSSSREQIASMAAALNPARLGESADIQNGAPIVGGDFIVESGNGRVLAIQSAMQQGKSAGYTDWLRQNAQTFGLDPSSITDKSVLVRVRDTDVDRAAFVKQANESTTASYSQTETAKSDAEKLTSDILLLYTPSESGEIATRENADFLTAFMQKVIPESEQASYRQADGSISQSGIARIRNALFQKAYGDTNLTAAISESTDEGVKNMLKALTNVAPRIAVIAEQIAGGTLHDLNIAPDLTAAALAYRQLRKNGDTVEDYLGQYRMPGFETESETAQEFMRMFDKHKRSAKGLTQTISGILDRIESYGDPRQVGLFEQTVPELAQLVKSAMEGGASAQQDGQTTMQFSKGTSAGTGPQGRSITKPDRSPQRIAKDLARDIGIGEAIGTKKMNNLPRAVLGYYHTKAKYIAVRPNQAGSYIVSMHEIGHAIADKIGMTGTPQMIANLDPVFASNYSAAELPGEAFAEFIWRYMADDALGRSFAGDAFVDTFEQKLRQHKLNKQVSKHRKALQAWVNAAAVDQIGATVRSRSNPVKKSQYQQWREIIDGWFDDTRAAEDVDSAIRKQGSSMSLRDAALMKNTAGNRAWNILTNNLTDAHWRIIGDSLAKRFEDAGIKGKDFDLLIRYALALHSMDRDAQGKPVFDEHITPTARQAFIDDVQQNHPEVVAAEQAWQTFRKEFMQAFLVDTGYLSQEAFDHMNAMYPHYVPTQRVKEGQTGGSGRKKTYQVKRATGSTEDIWNPMDTFVETVNSIVTMVSANNAALSWDTAYRKYEGLGEFGREITPDVKEVSIDTTQLQKQVEDALTGNTADDVLQDVLDIIGTRQSQWQSTKTSTVQNVLAVQQPDGSQTLYQIFDPELYKLLASLKDSSYATNEITKAIGGLTRMMTSLTTGSNPVFAVRNFMRDFQNSVNYGSWASNYATGALKWLRAAYDVWTEGGEYADYKALGGGGWARIDAGRKKGSEEYRAALFEGYDKRNLGAKVKKAGQTIWKGITLERLNEVVEQTSRYAEYRYGEHDKATAEGRARAFLAGQDATVDFNRSGNGNLSPLIRACTPFFGAASQGTYRLVRSVTEESERAKLPARFAKTVINTGLMSALSVGLLKMFLDDEEKEEFEWLSDDMKAQHFYLPNFAPEVFGEQPLLRIPITQDPLAFAVHGAVTNALWNGDEAVIPLAAVADNILNNLNPMGSSIAQPIIDADANRTWYGSNIVPTRMENWNKTTQYTEETPMIFRELGRLTGNSPLVLQYLAEQYTGFLGQMLIPAFSYDANGELGGVDAALNAARKKLTSDPLVSQDIIGSFYDGYDLMEEVTSAVKNGRPLNMLRPDLTNEEAQQAYQDAYDLIHAGGVIYEAKQAISDGYSEIDSINANETLTDEQKYELTSEVRRGMIETALGAQEAIGTFTAHYITGKTLVSRIAEGAYTTVPTAYDKLPQTFHDDAELPYMQQATAVWEATGKESALPHPNESFSVNGTEYVIEEADWDNWTLQYKMAYQKYLVEHSKGWDALTSEEQLEIMQKAHSSGHNAAKKWYSKLHRIK